MSSLAETPELRPMSPDLVAQLEDALRPAINNPATRRNVVEVLGQVVRSVDANAHARGRAEAAAIVEAVLANVDELVEASSPDAEITVDQATVVRVLLREALGAADTLARLRAAWAEGARFACLGVVPTRTAEVYGTGHPVPDGLVHLGSTVTYYGRLVWHLYAEPLESPGEVSP